MPLFITNFPPQSSPGRPSDASGLVVLVKKGIENQGNEAFFSSSRGKWAQSCRVLYLYASATTPRDTPLRSTALRCQLPYRAEADPGRTAFVSPTALHLTLIAAAAVFFFFSIWLLFCALSHHPEFLALEPRSGPRYPSNSSQQPARGAKAEEPNNAGPTTPVPYTIAILLKRHRLSARVEQI